MRSRHPIATVCFILIVFSTGRAPLLADAQVLAGHKLEVMAVAVRPDGKLLASAGVDGTVRLWSLPDGKALKTLDAHAGGAFAAVFTPDGKRLVTAGADKQIRVWDADGQEVGKWNGHRDKVAALAISRDGAVVASGGYDGIIRIWDMKTEKEERAIQVYKGRGIVTSLAFAPDGKSLLSGGATEDNISLGTNLVSSGAADVMRLWNVADGKLIRKFDQRAAQVAFSPDGEVVAGGAHLNEVEKSKGGHSINGADFIVLMDLTGKVRQRLRLYGEGVGFSPDGKWLVTGAGSCRHESEFGIIGSPGYREEFSDLNLWDAATGKEALHVLDDDAATFAVTPDGKTLASANHAGVITLRDIGTAMRNPFPDWPAAPVPEKYAAVCRDLDARFEELLNAEKDPQPLRDAARKFRRTNPASGGTMWYYTAALRLLRETRSSAGVSLLVRHAIVLGAGSRDNGNDFANTLVVLTGLDVPDGRPDTLVEWWAKNKDKIETDVNRMPVERRRVIAERFVRAADQMFREEIYQDDRVPGGRWTLERMRSVLNRGEDDALWLPQDLHRDMLPVFLASAATGRKPVPAGARRTQDLLLNRIPLMADLARREPAAVQAAADDQGRHIDVRVACLVALQLAKKDQTKAFLTLLADEKDQDRRIVLTLSLALGDKLAASALVKLLDDSDPLVQQSAVKALLRHRSADALPRLKQMLNDPKTRGLSRDIYRVIANIDTRDARATLAAALRSELEREDRRELVRDALSAFEHATGKTWTEAGAHPPEYYRDAARKALQWWDEQNPKP